MDSRVTKYGAMLTSIVCGCDVKRTMTMSATTVTVIMIIVVLCFSQVLDYADALGSPCQICLVSQGKTHHVLF